MDARTATGMLVQRVVKGTCERAAAFLALARSFFGFLPILSLCSYLEQRLVGFQVNKVLFATRGWQ
jgi:hypothetical protein